MNLRNEIGTVFEGKAFLRPLFYSYPGGLRFELSEGGTEIARLLLAIKKSTQLCNDIFAEEDGLVVCLSMVVERGKISFYAPIIRELRAAGIKIPHSRCIWAEAFSSGECLDENTETWMLHVAFEMPKSSLQNVLWCACVSDMGFIRPRPSCMVHLFNMKHRVMVWPYDDRGMDVVGPNHEFLSRLYMKHQEKLLDYDRDVMVKTFEVAGSTI